jgi:exodeoxyribonuclease VII small subunit
MASNKKFNFGEAFGELEKIVQQFERDDVDLENALLEFERGLLLAQKCKTRLSEIENKVKEIKIKFEDGIDKN